MPSSTTKASPRSKAASACGRKCRYRRRIRPTSRVLRLAPSQAPQAARREDEGEAPKPAERPERPDEEKAAGGPGDLAVMRPSHVDDGHACREQPDEQHDGV